MQGRLSVFFGQSGVGKSSILNHLDPDIDLKVGEISHKYQRGAHITSFSSLILLKNEFRVIDTPGIRELELFDINSQELPQFFHEFKKYSDHCRFPTCTHVDEPDCAVKDAYHEGLIHFDRFENYLKIFNQLKDQEISFSLQKRHS